MTEQELSQMPVARLLDIEPAIADLLVELGVTPEQHQWQVGTWVDSVRDECLCDSGLPRHLLLSHLCQMWQQIERMQQGLGQSIERLTVLPGVDKQGEAESQGFVVHAGEIISIVGPTGAGKSCLLADIESLAQGDTPTQRHILLNDEALTASERQAMQHQLVAQLSQNMNFVVDLTVQEFVTLHARCRQATPLEDRVEQVIACANELTGEKFSAATPVTRLSGGQSRALMIADTALLGAAPIVLIDEIENAGVDRERALDLLVSKEKIIFISTHDPLLALRANKRLVIRNGGVHAIYTTSSQERDNLCRLEELEQIMLQVRDALRQGERINELAAN